MGGNDPVGDVGEIGADLLDQMLAQRPGTRRGLVDPAHVIIVAPPITDLPGLRIAAAIERTVAVLARGVAPVLGGIARQVPGKRAVELLRQRHRVPVGLRRNGIGRRHRCFVGIPLAVFEQRVLLDLSLDKLGQLDIRQLQHLDCLLQLRGHHQRLALAQFKAL